MRNRILATIAAAGIATIATMASGATLSVQSDKTVYFVGETVTLRIVGDAQGETSHGIYGRLVYSGVGRVWPRKQTQWLIGASWLGGGIRNGGGLPFSEAFSQIAFQEQTSDALSDDEPSILPPQTADLLPTGNPFSEITLLATRPGVVIVSWSSDLEWFSTTPATAVGTSFVIVPAP